MAVRSLWARLSRHSFQPQRPAPCQLVTVVEKADADWRTTGLLVLFVVVDRRGRPGHPHRGMRTGRPHPNDVYFAQACRTKLPVRPKRHAEPVPGSVSKSP